VKIHPNAPIWIVTDPGPDSTLPDVCFETNGDGLRLQFAGASQWWTSGRRRPL